MVSVTSLASLFHRFAEERPPSAPCRGPARGGRALALAAGAAASLRTGMGCEAEESCLQRYADETGAQLVSRSYRLQLRLGGRVVEVEGRPDAVRTDGVVVEHKRRVHRLLRYVPEHERVQCYLYMQMAGATLAHLVETFGQQMVIHEVQHDEAEWAAILLRLEARLREG